MKPKSLFNAARTLSVLALSAALITLAGCGGGTGAPGSKHRDYFTSGSREADQRASQRMAKEEQLADSGEGAGEKGVKKASAANPATDGSPSGATNQAAAARATEKMALCDRLGGEQGISKIVDDFTQRALQDPRINWQRKGIKRGGLSIHRDQSVTWKDTPQNVAKLKTHIVQFLALATGGPAHYEGKDIKSTHADLHIDNPEFDAAIGDLKASLDKLQIPNKEQKELLSIVESTRPEIVTVR